MSSKIDVIRRELIFSMPIEVVWRAITDPKEVALWFGSAASFELTEGSLGYFEWEDEGRFAMQVESVEVPTYFSWRWMHNPNVPFDAKASTWVEWRLTSIEGKRTKLVLTESGFTELKHKTQNQEGWSQELGDLESYFACYK